MYKTEGHNRSQGHNDHTRTCLSSHLLHNVSRGGGRRGGGRRGRGGRSGLPPGLLLGRERRKGICPGRAVILIQGGIAEGAHIGHPILDPGLELLPDAAVILLGALGKEVALDVQQHSIPVEVVRLEEARPKVLLRHVGRHVLQVLSTHRGIRLEDGLDHVRGQVVAEAVGAVSLYVEYVGIEVIEVHDNFFK